ncbi:MAG TPA: hypothetical protein VFW33_06220 [Gemmataceae bacterium]|nr:hypothetical protein [Gemmataceae bacterium]
MIPAPDAARLEAAIRREGRSLLQYVSEAFPWTKAVGDATPDKVRDLAREERDALGVLTKYLARQRHAVPYLGAFPMSFTTMNFVSLDYLLPRLTESARQSIAALEKDRAALADADAKAELDRLVELKKNHLKALEGLTTAPAH